MKFTSYLYIFALTVLCSPRFLMKDKSPNYILYSIIFTLILYITIDFINKYTENYEQYNVDVNGVDSLVDLIKPQGGTNESNKIDINNHLSQKAGADDANCWNAFGKNKKELEIIKVQLDSYAGSIESIDKLNNQLDSQKEEIDKLQNELKGFEGTKAEIDQINIQIKKYQGEIDKLQQQLALYNQTSETIGEVNYQIAKIESTITDLNTKISVCNTVNSEKEQNNVNLTRQISEHGPTITSLETRKTDLTNSIAYQNEKIASLEKTINDKTGCEKIMRLKFRFGSNPWDGSGAINYFYLTYNGIRVTNSVNVQGKYFHRATTYSQQFTTHANQSINGFFIDVGNDGIRIFELSLEKLVNSTWQPVLNSYSTNTSWIKNRSYQFTFPSTVK